MIKDKSELQTALIDSVMACDLDCVRRLLLEGANPDVGLDEAQVTPLHFAAQNSDVNIVKELLRYGANSKAKTVPDGETPLDIACLYNHPAIIELLK